MENHDVSYVSPWELKQHELNHQIYQDAPDDEFLESVKSLGILEPLVALPDNTVLSGHRRMVAGRLLEMESVPVMYYTKEVGDDEAVRILILANRQRDKTNEQKGREYRILKGVESRLAKARMSGTADADEPKGRSRDIAAKAVGFDWRTAEAAVDVIEEIDAAVEEGDEERADQLRHKLNRSVRRAQRHIVKSKGPVVDDNDTTVPVNLIDTFKNASDQKSVITKMGFIIGEIAELCEQPGGEVLPRAQLLADCKNVQQSIVAGRPHAVCPICKGLGCNECDQLGWMHKDQWTALPQGLRGKVMVSDDASA